MKTEDIQVVLATDCGSTTTKAILIERRDGCYRLAGRGEAPTTVEAPFEDVTKGVLNAVAELQELSGRQLLTEDERILKRDPARPEAGADIYVSTSSAGGGLQMMVAGVVKTMTAESAERAALGAGAIVMDVLAANDGRVPHERIERIRHLRPDMILLSGGIDGGTVTHVVEMAELVAAARPRPRLGHGYALPVIYAGNQQATSEVERILGDKTALQVVDNLRPVLERENLQPARDKIHDLFMEHVMAQAPGYAKLMTWTDVPIMPTPGAVGQIITTIAERDRINVVGVDIGGATTDVFSVFGGAFNRTVSANLGMSYSVSNVLAQAGLEQVLRWVPFAVDGSDLLDRVGNKMIRPTTIPQTLEDLIVEHALAREALRLSFEQHREFAVALRGVQRQRTIADVFEQTGSGSSLVDLMELNLLVGSGGVLSHAPRRAQTAMLLIDAFQPEGITRLAVDSIFMMPHLGVLSTVHPKAASEVFEKDCLIYLGTCIAPRGTGKPGKTCFTVRFKATGEERTVQHGELVCVPLEADQEVQIEIVPGKGLDVGEGPGKPLTALIRGGVVGLLLDGRGRPLNPGSGDERVARLRTWASALSAYPEF